jgi:hypothetical protein
MVAHGTDKEEEADQGHDVYLHPEERHGLADLVGSRREHGVVLHRVEHGEDGEDAEREAEIADAVDDEGFDRRGVGSRLVVPEADQEVGGEANALPAEEQLDKIVRGDERQHGESEHRQVSEEALLVRVVIHVADGIEVHEAGHGGYHHQHHCRERVDAERPGALQRA